MREAFPDSSGWSRHGIPDPPYQFDVEVIAFLNASGWQPSALVTRSIGRYAISDFVCENASSPYTTLRRCRRQAHRLEYRIAGPEVSFRLGSLSRRRLPSGALVQVK
jgi:hypothetical protein